MTDRLPDRPCIAVVGAGGVGAYYGGRLAQHGHDVHFLLHSDYDAVRRDGWTVKSIDGDFALPAAGLRLYNDPKKMPRADLVIVTLKSTANHLFESHIRPLLKDDTLILTLQNGLGNEEQLADLFGPDRILGGIAFVCINRITPGVIHHLGHGLLRLGDFQEGRPDRVTPLAGLFNNADVRADTVESLRCGRWEKLVWNVPFGGLGAVLDLTTDRLIDNEPGLHLVRSLMREVIAGARADGIHLPDTVIEEKIAQTRSMGVYRSSMQVDRQTRRPMEVQAILGRPLRAAEEKGFDLPCLRAVCHMAQLIDTSSVKYDLPRPDPGV